MITRPAGIQLNLSPNFGIPKGVPGRSTFSIRGVVLHCLDQRLEQYVGVVCQDLKISKSKPRHSSLHYAVGYEGVLYQFVEDLNISWGFSEYLGNFPGPFPISGLNWPPHTTTPPTQGVTPDYYVLNVGLESGFVVDDTCTVCPGPTVLKGSGYRQLIHLLAWLFQETGLTPSPTTLTFDQFINPAAEDECACADLDQIITDILAYCEPCFEPAPVLPELPVVKILGKTAVQCEGVDEGCLAYTDLGEIIEGATTPCELGNKIQVGIAIRFVGKDFAGCLVSDIVHADDPITGTGVASNPLDVDFSLLTLTDLCALAAVIPFGEAVSIIGVGPGGGEGGGEGCLVREDGTTFVQGSETSWLGTGTGGITVAGGGINGHAPTIGLNLCNLLIPGGDIHPERFLGLDDDGCVVRAPLATGGAIVGSATVGAPLTIDLCLLGAIIPVSPSVSALVGVEGGCVVQTPVATVIGAGLCSLVPTGLPPAFLFGRSGPACPDVFSPAQVVQAGLIIADSQCIDLDFSGGTLTAFPIIAPAQAGIDNALTCLGTGLYVPDVSDFLCNLIPSGAAPIYIFGTSSQGCPDLFTPAQLGAGGGTIAGVLDTACINLTINASDELSADPIIAPAQAGVDNVLSCLPDGLYVPRGAGAATAFGIGGDGSDTSPLVINGGQTLNWPFTCAITNNGIKYDPVFDQIWTPPDWGGAIDEERDDVTVTATNPVSAPSPTAITATYILRVNNPSICRSMATTLAAELPRIRFQTVTGNNWFINMQFGVGVNVVPGVSSDVIVVLRQNNTSGVTLNDFAGERAFARFVTVPPAGFVEVQFRLVFHTPTHTASASNLYEIIGDLALTIAGFLL